MSTRVAIDDRDPSITYSAGWGQGGSADEHNSTTTFSSREGRTATVSFTGTSIGVYGTIPFRIRGRDAPESTYSIDGGRPVRFKAEQTSSTQYQQLFFESGRLPNVSHNLTITNESDGAALFLDFMVLEVPNRNTTSTSTTPSTTNTSTTPTTTSPSTTSTSTPPATTDTQSGGSTPTDVSAKDPNATSATGSSGAAAVAGGVIAGVVVLFLAVLAFVFWRRRKNRNNDLPDEAEFFTTPAARPSPPPPRTNPAPEMSSWPAPHPASLYPSQPSTPYYQYQQPQRTYAPPSQLYNPYTGYDQPSQNVVYR